MQMDEMQQQVIRDQILGHTKSCECCKQFVANISISITILNKHYIFGFQKLQNKKENTNSHHQDSSGQHIDFEQFAEIISKLSGESNCPVKVQFSTSDFDDQQMLLTVVLLKMVRIKQLDTKLYFEIDNEEDYDRHIKNNANASFRTSFLWSSLGLYMMHIGYDIECGQQRTKQNISFCKSKCLQFCCVFNMFNQGQIFQLSEQIIPIINMDPMDYILQEEVLELYIMRVATEHNEKTIVNNEVNPLAQILPIFKWNLQLLLKPITQTDDINYRNEMQHYYNDYQNMLTQLKETGKCEVIKNNVYLKENRLLIPFHFSQSEQFKSELQPFVSLIVEQSHAFKIVHMVLNLIFHQYQESSASCTNYVLPDGSTCGKTTFDLSLAYTLTFHPDIDVVPVVVQNISVTTDQPLAQYAHLYDKSTQNLNVNFLKAVKEINVNRVGQSAAKIIVANFQDYFSYPDIVKTLAKQIYEVSLQVTCLKRLINSITKDVNLQDFYSEQQMIAINQVADDKFISSFCTFVLNQNRCNNNYNNDSIIENFKSLIESQKLMCKDLFLSKNKSKFSNIFKLCIQLPKINKNQINNIFVIDDEVCNRMYGQHLDAYDSSLIFRLIQEIQSNRYQQNIIDCFNNLNNKENVKLFKSQKELVQLIPDTERQILMLFPLALFIKSDLPQFTNNLHFETMMKLLSTQGYEAIMLRDLSNELDKIMSNSPNQLSKQVVLALLKKSFLGQQSDVLNNYYEKQSAAVVCTLFSGTCCSLIDFYQFSSFLASYSGSRDLTYENLICDQNCSQKQDNFQYSEYEEENFEYEYFSEELDDLNDEEFEEYTNEEEEERQSEEEEESEEEDRESEEEEEYQDDNDDDDEQEEVYEEQEETNEAQECINDIQQNMCQQKPVAKQLHVHASTCPLPQLHACKTNGNYSLYGINSMKIKKYQLKEQRWQNTILNLLLACNTNSTGYIQTLFSQVSHQLLINKVINKVKNEIIHGQTQKTYINILNKDDLIDKINCNNQLIQTSIMKETNTEKILLQNIRVKQSNQLVCHYIKNPENNIFIQPLSQSNLPQLADVFAVHLHKFSEILTDNSIQLKDIIDLIISNQAFLGGKSHLYETLYLILLLFHLKYGRNQAVQNLEQILIFLDLLFDPCNEKTNQIPHYFGILNKSKNAHDDISNVKTQEIYITSIQPQFTKLGNQSYQEKQLSYQELFEYDNIPATKIVADYQFKNDPTTKIVIVVVSTDQNRLVQLGRTENNVQHVDFIITIHLRDETVVPKFDLCSFNVYKVKGSTIYFLYNELGRHDYNDLLNKVSLSETSQQKTCVFVSNEYDQKFLIEQLMDNKKHQLVYQPNSLRFMGSSTNNNQLEVHLTDNNQILYDQYVEVNKKKKEQFCEMIRGITLENCNNLMCNQYNEIIDSILQLDRKNALNILSAYQLKEYKDKYGIKIVLKLNLEQKQITYEYLDKNPEDVTKYQILQTSLKQIQLQNQSKNNENIELEFVSEIETKQTLFTTMLYKEYMQIPTTLDTSKIIQFSQITKDMNRTAKI
ncbi:Hypothetical_protein [Hexamita inflata]|uniref:Hypothetical_protein n=1 Tax=Hexamita inflata TaxID=28002 RepID=A0AA86R7H2_9EUKA|nr:Hypothetical protein HINF_LOCUS60471 [Hexamita inflata]